MASHWPSVRNILQIISCIVERDDPNGMDLYLLNADRNVHASDSSFLTGVIDQIQPSGHTNPEKVLERILKDYEGRLSSDAAAYPLSIYILTDGVCRRTQKSASEYMLTFCLFVPRYGVSVARILRFESITTYFI
jgi:hypothetical protein